MLKLEGRIVAVTPIVHSGGNEGISTLLRREVFIIDGKPIRVPVISGNAIRGVLRRIVAKAMLELLECDPTQLPPLAYHLLHDGGIIQEAVHVEPDVDFLRQVRALLPNISLFGGCVRQTPLSGRLIVSPAVPICKETQPYTGIDSVLSLSDIVGEIMFTRRDDREGEKLPDAVQMRYFVECFNAGTEFVHSFIVKSNVPQEIGALHLAIQRFTECPYLGARSAVGLGKVSWTYKADAKLVTAFEKFVKQHKTEILNILHSLG